MEICKTCGAVLFRTEIDLEDIIGQEHAKRALEVALAGHHTIAFFGNREAEVLAEIATRLGVTVWAVQTCPCGYRGFGPQRECICNLSQVAHWQKRKVYQNAHNADIVVECPPAYAYQIDAWVSGRRSELETIILSRVKNRGKLPLIHLDTTGRSLLKIAATQLNMNIYRVKTILRVAQTIAALGHSDQIGVVHLAEAIQYRPRNY